MTVDPSDNVLPLVAPKPNAAVVVVTPEVAKRWLAKNERNRKIRDAIVDGYARDMGKGRWELTGEAIKFASDGSLLDGQHRLKAVVKSGTHVPMFVVRGLQSDSQHAMDTGAKRTAADALGLDGEQGSSILAATARVALAVEANRLGRWQPTSGEIRDFVSEQPEIREAAAFARSVARRTDCPPAIVAYTTWRLSQIDPAQARQFWIDAAEKVGLRAGDPVIALTNRLAESRRNRQRLSHEMLLSAVFRAWNARRSGSTLRLIKVNSPNGDLVPIPNPK